MSTAAAPSSSPIHVARVIAADIKLAHSVFAMPFAILAAFIAAIPPSPANANIHWPRFIGQLVLVVLAMVFARTVAMLANRALDAEIDKRNPRTTGRAIASGRLTMRSALLAIIACAGAFTAVCAAFGVVYDNWWPLILSLPVLAWISAYGLFKRFTALCHVYLGSSLGISPVAAAIAVNPAALIDQPSLWFLSGMVLCWVAGFDIIYALQDVDVDRRDNLHSMPSRVGVKRAMWVSRGLHMLAFACLAGAWWMNKDFGAIFGVGIVVVGSLLLYEHLTVARWGTTKVALAFFTLNGIISCLLGALGVLDVVV